MSLHFDERYRTNNTPWEIHRPDASLVRFIEADKVGPCQALDIGCGSGNNAIWLAQQGFMVTGIDSSALALERAKAKDHKGLCDFQQVTFPLEPIAGAPFGFVVDRGCFHHFREQGERLLFASRVAELLSPQGCWLSFIGNSDESREGPGPPTLTAQQVCQAVEPFFIIHALIASFFDSDQDPKARNWICHMEKRS